MQAPGLLSIEESTTRSQGYRPRDGTLAIDSAQPCVLRIVSERDDHRTRLAADSVVTPLNGELLSLVNPSLGLGSENSGHDIDQSLGMRTSSY